MTSLLSALYWMLPAFAANVIPVITAKLKLPFGIPISAEKLGKNKTWRGVYSGYLAALGILFLQKHLQNIEAVEWARVLNYQEINLFLFAFLFGIGALLGDIVESYFKRKKGIPSGGMWFPYDQLDFVIGTFLFVFPCYFFDIQGYVQIDIWHILWIIILTPGLQLLVSWIGFHLKIKNSKH